MQKFLAGGLKNGQTNLIPISGRVPVPNLEFAHGRSGFQPTVENLPKGRHGSGEYYFSLAGFLRWMFWSRNAKGKTSAEKIRRKIRQPKTKDLPAHDPPKSTSQPQKSAAKPTNKSTCQSSRYTPGSFFLLRRLALGGVFIAWILGLSLVALWAWSRFPY